DRRSHGARPSQGEGLQGPCVRARRARPGRRPWTADALDGAPAEPGHPDPTAAPRAEADPGRGRGPADRGDPGPGATIAVHRALEPDRPVRPDGPRPGPGEAADRQGDPDADHAP